MSCSVTTCLLVPIVCLQYVTIRKISGFPKSDVLAVNFKVFYKGTLISTNTSITDHVHVLYLTKWKNKLKNKKEIVTRRVLAYFEFS